MSWGNFWERQWLNKLTIKTEEATKNAALNLSVVMAKQEMRMLAQGNHLYTVAAPKLEEYQGSNVALFKNKLKVLGKLIIFQFQ